MKFNIIGPSTGSALMLALAIGQAHAQSGPTTLFGNTAPSPLSSYTDTPISVGVKFWSAQAGTISGIRFYRAAVSTNGYSAKLYTANGSQLSGVWLAHESGPVPGWQVALFQKPVAIAANTTYVASYNVPRGNSYQLVAYGLANAVTSGPLTAPAGPSVGNGVYYNAEGFPATASPRNSNFLVDVLFTPAAPVPYLSVGFDPTSPTVASNAAPGTVIATINASWSDGSPFTGTLSFGPPNSNDNGIFAISGNQLVVSPSGPGLGSAGNSTQNVTIVATQ